MLSRVVVTLLLYLFLFLLPLSICCVCCGKSLLRHRAARVGALTAPLSDAITGSAVVSEAYHERCFVVAVVVF